MKNIKDKLIGIDNKVSIKLTKTTRLLLYVVGVIKCSGSGYKT